MYKIFFFTFSFFSFFFTKKKRNSDYNTDKEIYGYFHAGFFNTFFFPPGNYPLQEESHGLQNSFKTHRKKGGKNTKGKHS